MPGLYIITGSNGAGKSTVGYSYFPEHITSIFDGDKLYLETKSRLWKDGIKVQKELNIRASDFVEKEFLRLAEAALKSKTDFAYEGHFSKEESWNIVNVFKKEGYSLHLVFFCLNSPELSSNRVLIRAKEGGHFVDALTLRENFFGNLEQLNKRFKIFDTIFILDTSTMEHMQLMIINTGTVQESVTADQLPEWFHKTLPDLVALI
ncbi:zeta toxin family protein [Niabella sp.]|uniref:zeta toxin family protein n=1 Tax=Niabella sp. TaxID=1962976 RepID=UPI00261E5D38|nr:zeta toxin family protein [Niabella sp.]